MKLEQLKHEGEKELIVLKESEQRKTEQLKHQNAKELLAMQPPSPTNNPTATAK
jgi:hypothetical protein